MLKVLPSNFAISPIKPLPRLAVFKPMLWVVLAAVSQQAVADDLINVYQQALLADPQLKSAELKIDIGSAQQGQALGQMLPQIAGSVNVSENNLQNQGQVTSKNYQGSRYTVSLTQSLIDFGKYWEWRRAQKVQDQYAAEFIEAQHTLMFNVVQRYFAVLDAEDELALSQSELQTMSSELEQVQKLFAKQLVKVTDVYEAEARLDQLHAEEIEAENKLIIAKQGLKELSNQVPEQLAKLRDGIEYKELEGKLEDWLEVGKSQNPSLSAQINAIEAASNNVAVQKSKYLPEVDLQLYYYNTNTGYQNVLTGQYQSQVAAINVTVPIFSGGTTTNLMYEAQSRLAMSKQEQESKLRALTKEISDAFSASNANARRIKASDKALSSATKSREAMQSGLRYGVETIVDLLRAQQQEFKAKRELVRAKYEYLINRVRFLKAIGSIKEDNLEEINAWLDKS